jgi:phage terminase small subunit
MPLSDKHLKFATAYLVDLSPKHAAITAGYSEDTADVYGCQLLHRPDIQAYVVERLGKNHIKLDAKASGVIRELHRLADPNSPAHLEPHKRNELDILTELYEMQMERIQIDRTTEKKIGKLFQNMPAELKVANEMAANIAAIREKAKAQLAKYLSLWVEKTESKVEVSGLKDVTTEMLHEVLAKKKTP